MNLDVTRNDIIYGNINVCIDVYDMFYQTYLQDKERALRWMIYLRDIKDGLGCRILSEILINLQKDDLYMAMKIAESDVEQFGRYDDLIRCYIEYNSSIQSVLLKKIYEQLHEDMDLQRQNKPISLLAKWLPSINTSSRYTRENARKICKDLLLSPRQYRKILSRLRQHIGIIETKIANKDYTDIDYSTMPKKALLHYYNAFMRNDEAKYTEFMKTQEPVIRLNDKKSFEDKLTNPKYDKIIQQLLS